MNAIQESSPATATYEHHLVEFLNAMKDSVANSGSPCMNSVYSEFADTPTRKRNRILQMRNETLNALEESIKDRAYSSKREEIVTVMNTRFVGFLVQFLCHDRLWNVMESQDKEEQTEGEDDRQRRQDLNNPSQERLEEIFYVFWRAVNEELDSDNSWRDSIQLSLFYPKELSVEDLCHLPSLILDNIEQYSQHDKDGENFIKKLKTDLYYSGGSHSHSHSCKDSCTKTYAILGYLITYLFVHDLEGVVGFESLRNHIKNQVITCGLVENRMYSMDYDAFMSGFMAYFLDRMDISSKRMVEGSVDVSNISSYVCILRDGLILEGMDVGMMVDCLLGNSHGIFLTFQEIIHAPNRRVVVGRIAKTLLYYVMNHIHEETVSSAHCIQILDFIETASSPETARMYLMKMNNVAKESTDRTLGKKRKAQGTFSSPVKMSIDPILVEIQVLLCIPKLKTAISLVQFLDEQPNVSYDEKARGWFHLLDYMHQKDMLLNEAKNAKFHSLTVGTKTGLDAILQFFQGIVHQVIDDVDQAIEERGGVMTDEEEQWIRYHQLKVRKTLLKFCFGRAAFSSFNGLRALEVASEVSGIRLEENNDFGAAMTQGTVCLKINDILQTEIEVPKEPLFLHGEEILDDQKENEVELAIQDKSYYSNHDDMISSLPTNIPIATEPIYDTNVSEYDKGSKEENVASIAHDNINDEENIVNEERNFITSKGNYEEIILSDSDDNIESEDNNEHTSTESQPINSTVLQDGSKELKDNTRNMNTYHDDGKYRHDESDENVETESEQYDDSSNQDAGDDEDIDDYGSYDSDNNSQEFDSMDGSECMDGSADDESDVEENIHNTDEYKNKSLKRGPNDYNIEKKRKTIEIGSSSDDIDKNSSDDNDMESLGNGYTSDELCESDHRTNEGESDQSHISNGDSSDGIEVLDGSSTEEPYQSQGLPLGRQDTIIKANDKNDGLDQHTEDRIVAKDLYNSKDLPAGTEKKILYENSSTTNEANEVAASVSSVEKYGEDLGRSSDEISVDSDMRYSASINQDEDNDKEISSNESGDESIAGSDHAEQLVKPMDDPKELRIQQFASEDDNENASELGDESIYESTEGENNDDMKHNEHMDHGADEDDYMTASERDETSTASDASIRNMEALPEESLEETSQPEDMKIDARNEQDPANDEDASIREVDSRDEKLVQVPEDTSLKGTGRIEVEVAREISDDKAGEMTVRSVAPDEELKSKHLEGTATVSSDVLDKQEAMKTESLGTGPSCNHLEGATYMALKSVGEREIITSTNVGSPEPVELLTNLHECTEQEACDNVLTDEPNKVDICVDSIATIANKGEAAADDPRDDTSRSTAPSPKTYTAQKSIDDLTPSESNNTEVNESKQDISTSQEQRPDNTETASATGPNDVTSNSVKDLLASKDLGGDVSYVEEQETDANLAAKNEPYEARICVDSSKAKSLYVIQEEHLNEEASNYDVVVQTGSFIDNRTPNDGSVNEDNCVLSSPPDECKAESQEASECDTGTRLEITEAHSLKDPCSVEDRKYPSIHMTGPGGIIGSEEHPEDKADSNSEARGSTSTANSDGNRNNMIDMFSNLNYRALQIECKKRSLAANGTTEELIERLKNAHYESTFEIRTTENPDADDSCSAIVSHRDNVSQIDNNDTNTQDDYSTFSYKELQKACTSRGISGRGKKEELRRRLIENNTQRVSKDEASFRDDDLSTASYRDLQLMCKRHGINARGKHDVLLSRLKEALGGEEGKEVAKTDQYSDSKKSPSGDKIDVDQHQVEPHIGVSAKNSSNKPSTFTKWAGEKISSMVDMLSPTSHRKNVQSSSIDRDHNGDPETESNPPASPTIPKNIDFAIPGSAGTLSLLSPAEDHSVLSMSSAAERGARKALTAKRKRDARPPMPRVPKKKAKNEEIKMAEVESPLTRSKAKSASVATSTRSRSSRTKK